MRVKLKILLSKWFLPKWIVLMIDMGITIAAFIITYFLRYNLFLEYANVPLMIMQIIAGIPFFVLAIMLFKQHQGIIRYSTFHDVWILFKSNLIVSIGFFLINYLGRYISPSLLIPYSVVIIHFFLSTFAMIFFRVIVLHLYGNLIRPFQNKHNVMIYGAGDLGNHAASMITKDKSLHRNIIGFIDDNSNLWKSTIAGIKVFSPEIAFSNVLRNHNVHEIILAISGKKITYEHKLKIVDLCLSKNVKVKEFHDTSAWLNGKSFKTEIKDLNIEDLLGRDPIELFNKSVSKGIFGKRVMITGGAGSIGSEIVRQLVLLKPQSIIIVDQAETAMFDIQNEILPLLGNIELQIFVSDVTNARKMRRIFNRTNPQIIYHAAAYKHVPLMEDQPYEAINNNLGGTKNIADLAVEFNVSKFVMVSSDKAVNPTNIMGATKRICEIYIQALSKQTGMKTEFITTRFGNVLGSNGSVIPTFKKQIKNGGPVTVTHKDIIRYFMTIPEACHLVLEAGFLGSGGKIYIFDMGNPVKIYDLAVRMISLSGFIPHQEIKIVETGLRPGEKLYEELLNVKEQTLSTANSKIMVAKIRPQNYELAKVKINELMRDVDELDNWQLVTRLKQIVPEFKSKNSNFEEIDRILAS